MRGFPTSHLRASSDAFEGNRGHREVSTPSRTAPTVLPASNCRSNPSLTAACSSAVCDIRRRNAGGAPDSRCSQPRGWRLARIPAHRCQRRCARFRSLLVHEIGAQEWCYSTYSATCAAPATHGPLSAVVRMKRLFIAQDLTRRYHHPRWRPRRVCAVLCFFFRVPTLFLAGRSRARTHTHASSFWLAVFVHAHARARPHARTRARTIDDERRDVRSAGVTDWITVRRGNMERTLTAEAGPSPCDPYRHALARRPPRKAPTFFFLKLLYENIRP